MDELTFWRECCRRGITVCQIPRPMKEQETVWLVEKHASFADRKTWNVSRTFDSFDELFRWIGEYLATGQEPKSRVS